MTNSKLPLLREKFVSKFILTCLLLGSGAFRVWSQGQVNFDTKSVGAMCYYCSGLTTVPLSGTAWFAQLYAASGMIAPESALAKVGTPVNFRVGVNAGYVQISGTTSKGVTVDPVVWVPTSGGPGGATTIQLRAWSSNHDTYEAAVQPGPSAWGKSPLLRLSATGNPAGVPPTVPVDLIGLQGFAVGFAEDHFQGFPCPEPSTYFMFTGGIFVLIAFQHKKAPKNS